MTYRYITSTIHAPLDDFFKKMEVYGDRYLIVVSGEDREEIVGIVTPTDVLKYFYRMEGVDLKRPHHIQEIMTKNPFIAKITDKCDEIANVMIERNISGVPVVDQKLAGLIRFRSFLEFLEV
ncbi:MAG: CBS domain-containing protein [Candidatus Altiarchaeota archaeon]|nr:CBS domain-containing protein [Candidatus Altiarchaeota archaeon]